jgi:hypothetical protein
VPSKPRDRSTHVGIRRAASAAFISHDAGTTGLGGVAVGVVVADRIAAGGRFSVPVAGGRVSVAVAGGRLAVAITGITIAVAVAVAIARVGLIGVPR